MKKKKHKNHGSLGVKGFPLASSLHHATPGLMYLSGVYSTTHIQAGQLLLYQSNNETANASAVSKE